MRRVGTARPVGGCLREAVSLIHFSLEIYEQVLPSGCRGSVYRRDPQLKRDSTEAGDPEACGRPTQHFSETRHYPNRS